MKLTAREISLQNNTDVQGWVAARAARIREECEAEGCTFYTTPAIPPTGAYANVYEYERSTAFDIYSDVHKDVYGYRPRGDFSSWTLETIEAEIESLAVDLDETYTESQWEAVADTLDENWSKWEKMAFDAGYGDEA
jgi:hypothetical protein